jgi:hypothetical protein
VSELDALQQTLAAEHAAIYVFGVLGGRAAALTDPPLRTSIALAYDVHVARRDHLRTVISDSGASPVAAHPAYLVPGAVTTASQVEAEALRVERACVAVYGALVAATASGANRAWAVDVMVATSVSELGFGGRPEALPGLGDAGRPHP